MRFIDQNTVKPLLQFFFVILIGLNFILIGIDKVNEAQSPDWGDTPHYLEGALFIKENGGILNFLDLCLSGQYKIGEYHPLYLLVLSPFASRDISFFPKAKYISLAIGFITLLTLFLIAGDLFGWHITFVGTALLGFNTTYLEQSSHVAVETLLILLILLGWYFMVKGLDNNKYWILAGISSGLAYMTKGTGIFMIPIFVISNLLIFRLRIIKNKYFWLFFLFFLVSSSPFIIRNTIVYKNPLYEGANSNMLWLDSHDELAEPKYELLLDWREHTVSVSNMPTMLSYIETHSFSEIVKRAMKGVKGESGLLLDSMNMLIIPKGERYFSFLLFILFFIGLIMDKDKRRTIYTIITMLIFFIPFSWYFQVWPPGIRFITPLIPLVCIYSSLGCIELVKYIDKNLLARHERFNLLPMIPHVLTAFLVLISGYIIATQKVYPSLHPVNIPEEDYELMDWMKNNIKEDDIVVFGPALHHWGLLYLISYQGKLVPFFPPAKTFSEFEDILKKRSINFVIIHKESYLRIQNEIKDYIKYDNVNGLVEIKTIERWKLIYKHSEKPTKFLIYRIDENGNRL